jgi:hypothetical protein
MLSDNVRASVIVAATLLVTVASPMQAWAMNDPVAGRWLTRDPLVSNSSVRSPNITLVAGTHGGATEMRFRMQKYPRLYEIGLELDSSPPGITLTDVKVVPGGLAFQLHADRDHPEVGFADNLIVEAFLEAKPKGETKEKPKGKEEKKANSKRRVSVGFLPAIPYEIVP